MKTQITQSARIQCTAQRLWALITQSDHFQKWYAFGGANIDLRPGGLMSLRWDEHGAFEAVVESVVPEQLFSFRWRDEPSPLVRISLFPEQDGATRVEIVESGELENPEQSALAWSNALRLLTDIAAKEGDV